MNERSSTLACSPPDPAVNHPEWCDPELCVTYPGGDRVHYSQPGYWIAPDDDFELRLIQIHVAGSSAPDAAFVSLSIPTRKGAFTLDDGFELTPRDARGLALQLLAFDDLAHRDER